MQKLFIKVIFFITGISLLSNLLGTLADSVAPLEDWRIQHQQMLENLQARQDVIEAITLGNSHSAAIDYSVLGIEGQTLAFAYVDLFEIEKYAAFLDDKLPNLKTVYIALSYYFFNRDNATFEPYRTLRIKFYSIVPAWSPIQGDITNFLLGKVESLTHVMSVVRSDSWQGVWMEMVNNSTPANPVPYDGVRTVSVWGECDHYTAEQLEAHAREIAGKNVSSSIRMADTHPGLEQDATNALARTIERLQARGIQVVLFTPTYYEKYNMYFAEEGSEMIIDMRNLTHDLSQKYRVKYYDFSNDPDITIHPELFYNSDHLNECGQRIFSVKLLEAMSSDNSFDE